MQSPGEDLPAFLFFGGACQNRPSLPVGKVTSSQGPHEGMIQFLRSPVTASLISLIAAEALFLTGSGAQELRFRLALRGASFLGNGFGERRQIYTDFLHAYSLHSSIVHRSRHGISTYDIAKCNKLIEGYIRESLHRLIPLAIGSPDKDLVDWDK